MQVTREYSRQLGRDGIQRAWMNSGRHRALLEVNNVWLVLMGCVAADIIWRQAGGPLPAWGADLLLGSAIGGSAGLCISAYRVWQRARQDASENARLCEELISESLARIGPSQGRAQGCVVVQDRYNGDIDGLVINPQSAQVALIASGEVIYGRESDLTAAPSAWPMWTWVAHRDRPGRSAHLPSGVAPKAAAQGA